MPVPDRMSLVGISGSSMADAWAIARDTILRWNGTSWKKVYKYDGPSPDFYGIWVSKRDDVWVLGTGLVVRYSARDGGAPAFRVHAESVRGAAYEVTSFWVNPASDQLWMATDGAGHGSFGYRYREEPDGTLREDHITEAPISFPWVGEDETFFVRSIFGFDSEDIYVGGEWCNTGSCSWSQETDRYGAIAHYDGRNWSIAKTLAKGQRVSKIYGTIVVSIDQSGSMSQEIEALKANINLLPSLLTASGLDYRVVMVAEVGRDALGVCVPPPLGGPDCGSNGTTFRAVDQHIESWDTLALLLKTLDYPSPTLAWRDFLRPGVLKVFVPITDDDSLDMDATRFDVELRRRGAPLFGTAEARNYVFFPVIGMHDYPDTTPCATTSNRGLQYERLAKLTNGRWFSVCRPSFRSILEEIGGAVGEAVSCEVAIPEPPPGATLDLEKLNVRITPANGAPVVVPQDPSRPCAAGADGWQFSADKKKIVLCGSARSSAKADPATKFTVGFGCNTTVG